MLPDGFKGLRLAILLKDALVYRIINSRTNPADCTGTLVTNANGTFTYTPGAGEQGTVTFDYTITDGDGDTSRAKVTVPSSPAPGV